MATKREYPVETLAYQIAKAAPYFDNSREAAKHIVLGRLYLMTELHGSPKKEIRNLRYEPKVGEIFGHVAGYFGGVTIWNWYEMTENGMESR